MTTLDQSNARQTGMSELRHSLRSLTYTTRRMTAAKVIANKIHPVLHGSPSKSGSTIRDRSACAETLTSIAHKVNGIFMVDSSTLANVNDTANRYAWLPLHTSSASANAPFSENCRIYESDSFSLFVPDIMFQSVYFPLGLFSSDRDPAPKRQLS